MSMVNPDFTTQLLATIAGGLVVQLVQPQWLLGVVKRSPKPASTNPEPEPRSEPTISNNGGNQIATTGKTKISGGITQIDYRHQTFETIVHEPPAPQPPQSDAETWGKIIGFLAVGIIMASMFLLFQTVIMWFCIGATAGLLIMTVTATIRSRKWLGRLAQGSSTAIAQTMTAGGVMLATWVGILTITRGSLSMGRIREQLSPLDTDNLDSTASAYTDYFFHTAVPRLIDQGVPAITFVTSAMLSVLAASALTGWAWSSNLRWHAYLRSTRSGVHGALTTRRASLFSAQKWHSEMIPTAVLGITALAFAYQWAFALLMSAEPPA